MKRIVVTFLAVLALIMPALAQNHKGKDREAMRREVQEFKLKFLAQEIDLKDDQKKAFIELYQQKSDEKAKVFRETREISKKLKDADNVSDAEYEAAMKAESAAKEKFLAIDKKYDEKFAQILTPKQIYKLKSAEEEFNKKMHEMRHNKKKSKK